MSDNSVVAALNAFPLGDNEEDLRFRLSAYGAKDLRGAYSSLQIQPQGKDRSALNNKAGYVSLLCEYWVALRDGAAVTANSTPKPGSTPVFRIFTRRSSTSSSGSASDPGEHPRENLHLDYNFPGDRYDAKELVEYSKALRNSPAIQLPRLHTKEEYKVWKNEVPLHFEPRTLGDITYGGECYDVDFGLRRVKFTEWYRARMNKAFSALALSVDLLFTLKGALQMDREWRWGIAIKVLTSRHTNTKDRN
ncbi:hypothetical protein PC129_g17106 [Phytophthora cactorum]|uniref:Uncharacterized protein n=1 Tax=Phytophthora cactorum TaxID=29920 RepID=A0A8T1HHZ7_9STRA|nr:hypothetical protein PC129_g17106 [Phytophthora cactorum]